jgi:hypothetical protein
MFIAGSVLQAVDVAELRHIVDCIVFPRRGIAMYYCCFKQSFFSPF